MNRKERAEWEAVKNLSDAEQEAWLQEYMRTSSARTMRSIRIKDAITVTILIIAALLMALNVVGPMLVDEKAGSGETRGR